MAGIDGASSCRQLVEFAIAQSVARGRTQELDII
jgi:hypothetical protein